MSSSGEQLPSRRHQAPLRLLDKLHGASSPEHIDLRTFTGTKVVRKFPPLRSINVTVPARNPKSYSERLPFVGARRTPGHSTASIAKLLHVKFMQENDLEQFKHFQG